MTKKLRDALQFYARESNWKRGGAGIGARRGTLSKAQKDGGELARKALTKAKPLR